MKIQSKFEFGGAAARRGNFGGGGHPTSALPVFEAGDGDASPCGVRSAMTRLNDPPGGVYVHIPFCLRKCAYCDFCSYAGLEALHDNYVRALETELARCQEDWRAITFDTLYFGGGTPTVLEDHQLRQLLDCLIRCFSLSAQAEITVRDFEVE